MIIIISHINYNYCQNVEKAVLQNGILKHSENINSETGIKSYLSEIK